jgi:hypothetical protein
MGGGKEKKKTNAMIDTDRAGAAADNTNYMNTVNTGLAGATGRAGDMYGVQYEGFKDFANGKYDYDPAKYGGGSGGGGGGGDGGAGGDGRFGEVEGSYRNFMQGGGVDTGMFNKFQGNLMDIAGNGGWDPARIASMDENIRGYKDIARTGGVDAEGMARMRGNGVFDEFAKTGGLSDADRGNIRSRATSTIPAFYRQMQEEANRGAAVQGGYGPGRSALAGRSAREQAAAGADAARDAELGIMSQVNEGRQWGSSNLADSEAGLQTLMSSNRLAGLGGAASAESNMLNSIAGNRTAAASAGGNNEIGMQGTIQKGKMFGTQGLEGMAESAAARGAASSAASAADARWRADFDRDSRMMGLEGMQSLYGMRPGEVDMYLDANLAGRQTNYGQQANTYDARMANNPKTDWMGMVGGLAGAAGGMMTGMGAMGFGAPRNTGINVGTQYPKPTWR